MDDDLELMMGISLILLLCLIIIIIFVGIVSLVQKGAFDEDSLYDDSDDNVAADILMTTMALNATSTTNAAITNSLSASSTIF